jgi:hypothetical protein
MPRARRRVEVEQVDTRTGHTRGGRHGGIGQRYDTTSSRQCPATTQRSAQPHSPQPDFKFSCTMVSLNVSNSGDYFNVNTS